jgi:hypothetical protein
MATYSQAHAPQSTPEIRTWVVDFTDDLLSGVTIASGTAIHTPPSGTAGTPTVLVSSPRMNVTLGPLSVTGLHYLEARATLSDGEISSVTIAIPVGVSSPTAREGMLNLIDQLRASADVGPNDYTVAGQSYWNDKQLQTVLDHHRITIYQEPLQPWPALDVTGYYTYYDYHAPLGNLESGTAVFLVQQNNGGSAPSYTADYDTGVITFSTDTMGSAYILTARSYDVNAAAAEVWRNKAANAAKYFDFRTDNHQVSKSQFYKQCLDMAKYFDSQSQTQSFSVTTMTRSDINVYGDDEEGDRR